MGVWDDKAERDELRKLRAEIEQWRIECADLRSENERLAHDLMESEPSKELRTELDIAQRAVSVTNNLWQSSEKECAELRAEIEQLRKNLEIWERNGGDILQRVEIERLEKEASQVRYAAIVVSATNEKLKDEIEWLTALVADLRKLSDRQWQELMGHCDRIDRLQAALKPFAELSARDWMPECCFAVDTGGVGIQEQHIDLGDVLKAVAALAGKEEK